MKKIGIIGSGVVAQALGTGFLKHGYQVMMGTRDASKLNEWKNKGNEKASIGSFNDAAAFGEIVVIAVKATAVKEIVKSLPAGDLRGKTIIDTNNPIADAPPDNGVLKFFTSLDRSLMEDLQSITPDANFVKAFSCIGSAFMVNPDFGGIKPTMFICGNSSKAKNEVSEIVVKFGFDVSDMGGVEAARAIEPLCILWCIPGITKNEWRHAFKVLK